LDDLDLDFGRIKIKPGGSSAGHRGLNSIIEALGTDEFARLRIGIGRPHRNLEPSEFVLSPFKRKEKEALGEVLEESCACVRAWAQGGVTQAMNIFNKRS
jgi:PTH1 family peptidyl-tRNA hydrolase